MIEKIKAEAPKKLLDALVFSVLIVVTVAVTTSATNIVIRSTSETMGLNRLDRIESRLNEIDKSRLNSIEQQLRAIESSRLNNIEKRLASIEDAVVQK